MQQKLVIIALVAALGILGTLARYGIQSWIHELTGSTFPWGTFAVNFVGCFLFGIVSTLAKERLLISEEARIILSVGFLGAFTTFSSFAADTAALLQKSQWMLAAGNVLLQNCLGLAAIFAGLFVGR